jgi:hypothetical protein
MTQVQFRVRPLLSSKDALSTHDAVGEGVTGDSVGLAVGASVGEGVTGEAVGGEVEGDPVGFDVG